MAPRMDTRMYTNLMLTAIALFILGGVARDYGVGIVGSAQAQEARTGNRLGRDVNDDIARTETGLTYDAKIPQSQDVAVAAATSEVAASNRDIAAAIRELALAVREGSADIKSGMGLTVGSGGAAPAATRSAPAAPAERPMIEVAP